MHYEVHKVFIVASTYTVIVKPSGNKARIVKKSFLLNCFVIFGV